MTLNKFNIQGMNKISKSVNKMISSDYHCFNIFNKIFYINARMFGETANWPVILFLLGYVNADFVLHLKQN